MMGLNPLMSEVHVIVVEMPDFSAHIHQALTDICEELRTAAEKSRVDTPPTMRHSHGDPSIQDTLAGRRLTERYGKLMKFELISIATETSKMNDKVGMITRTHKRALSGEHSTL
jgi:hypothetical protein